MSGLATNYVHKVLGMLVKEGTIQKLDRGIYTVKYKNEKERRGIAWGNSHLFFIGLIKPYRFSVFKIHCKCLVFRQKNNLLIKTRYVDYHYIS